MITEAILDGGYARKNNAAGLPVTLARPKLLRPANRAWMVFGLLLGKIVSPIVLGVLYFGVFATVGSAMRLAGRDPLLRMFDQSARSYWIERDPPGPDPQSLRDQG